MLCAGGGLQEGWGQTSTELFPLPPVRAALSPGFCALYLTSRQDFVWSQGCNIIPAHSPVLYWQSGWAHYREQNKRWLLILSLAACSEIPLLLLISGSVCTRTQQLQSCAGEANREHCSDSLKILISGADKPLNSIVSQCRSCTGAQVWVLGGSLYRFLLC